MPRRKKPSSPEQEVSQDASPRSLPAPSFGLLNRTLSLVDDSEEYPTRSPKLAKQLIELVNGCPEAAMALEITCAYVLSSGTGDELGFAVVVDEQSPKPRTVAIARNVLGRVGDIWLWWQVVWRMLAWGDAFGFLDIDTSAMRVEGLRLLPTWQCHVIPDENGVLSRYEQRVPGMREAARITALGMVQWSYSRRFLYGRSIYREALNDWAKLKDADQDVADASRQSVIQPNLHIMPPGTDRTYKEAYREDHEARKKQGIIADIYLQPGGDVRKPQGLPATFPLTSLMGSLNLRRLRIAARSRVPLYLLGIESKYAREIAYQPAIAFVVHVGVVRQLFAAGLRQVINTELALKQVPIESWKYKIVFPKINVNPWMPVLDEDVDEEGVSELDRDELEVGEG